MATVVAKGIRALSTTYRKFRRANSFESPDIVTVHCKFRRTNLFDSSDVTKLERGESRSKSIRGKAGKACLGFVTGIVGGCGAILYFLDRSVKAYASTIALPRYPWEFNRTLKSFDHAALRRGWQVYRTVCYTCHSLKYVCFLDLVEVTHSREEVKAIAAEFEVMRFNHTSFASKKRNGFFFSFISFFKHLTIADPTIPYGIVNFEPRIFA